MYSDAGRPSIPSERLLKASLLIALYSVRSDRLFCEQLSYNILFRWFLDMSLEEPSFDASTFSKNRERLIRHEAAIKFFDAVVCLARGQGPAVRRTLQCRRHPDRGLGVLEELQAQGRP
jgi:transposase